MTTAPPPPLRPRRQIFGISAVLLPFTTGGTVDCVAQDFDLTWFEHASIRPGSGNLTALGTEVTVFALPLDSFFMSWHHALQSVACARDRVTASQVLAFVQSVGSLRTAGDVLPVTVAGECSLTGGLRLPPITGGATQYTFCHGPSRYLVQIDVS